MNYKVGDIVKVVGPKKSLKWEGLRRGGHIGDKGAIWVEGMNASVGKVCTITRVGLDSTHYFLDGTGDAYYVEQWLKPVYKKREVFNLFEEEI